MPDSNRPPASLSRTQREGAAEILDRLVREREATLRRIARAAAGAEADEAFQNACLGFLKSFDPTSSYDGLDGAQQYLATAIYNHTSKLRRGQARRERALPRFDRDEERDPVDGAPATDPGPLETLERREEVAEARAAMAHLPKEWQAILVARATGAKPSEIQEALGLTERQYRKRIQKANRLLRGQVR